MLMPTYNPKGGDQAPPASPMPQPKPKPAPRPPIFSPNRPKRGR